MSTEARKRVLHTLSTEQQALGLIKKSLTSAFFKAIDCIAARKGKIIVTGVGKSGFIGMKVSATLTSLGHQSFFLNPVDALHGDSGVIRDGDVVLAISASGETAEILKIARYLKKTFSVSLYVITGRKTSTLARLADGIFLVPVRTEGCPLNLAPMASTTGALVMGDLIASALTSPKTFGPEHFAKFHPAGHLGLSMTPVSRVMTTDVPIVPERASLDEALNMISEKHLGIVAVVGVSGVLTGVITDGDVRRFLVRHKSIESKKATDAMIRYPKTILGTVSLKDALQKMEDHKITSLFVVNKKRVPIGIIHIHSIIQEFVI